MPLILVETLDSDSTFDGRLDDAFLSNLGVYINPVPDSLIIDTDRDGIPDYIDADSDNDGLSDLFEYKYPSDSSNLYGWLPPFVETDSNGACDNKMIRALADADGATESTRIPDFRDLDSDQDGMPDLIEAGYADSDIDGVFKLTTDNDINNDGWIDSTIAATGDPDRDGFYNQLDLDSDNDGISDLIEHGGKDSSNIGMVADSITDPDANGWDNNLFQTTILNHNDDLIPDYLDLDSDNDGIYDIVEGGGIYSDSGRVSTNNNPVDRGWDFDGTFIKFRI